MRSFLVVATSLLALAGCAGSPATPPSTDTPTGPGSTAPVTPVASASGTPLATPSEAPSRGVTTITIELADGKASPNGDRVELARGEPFVLDITSDRDDEVHIHGIDREIEIGAGEHQRVELSIDTSGRYEVESHHPELLIVMLLVR